MEITETAKPAHLDGGGLRELEQLGGQLEKTDSTPDSARQARAGLSTLDRNAPRIGTTSYTTPNQGSEVPAPTPPRRSYSIRLNGKPVTKVAIGVCRECNTKFTAKRATKDFCSTEHRQRFNNRQMLRGKEIYSIAMDWRDSRDPKTLTLLCRILASFKNEDERDGRRSWDDAATVIRDKPYLTATLLDTNLAGLRRARRRK
jgi:hypothetical protein